MIIRLLITHYLVNNWFNLGSHQVLPWEMETKTGFSERTFQKNGNPAQFFGYQKRPSRKPNYRGACRFPPFLNIDQVNGGSMGSRTHSKRVRLRLFDPQSTPQS